MELKIFNDAERGDVDSLKLLLSNSPKASQLILHINREGETTLHRAKNRDTAQVLVESVKPTERRELLWLRDKHLHRTALDVAVRFNRADVVEYLCGIASANESLLDGHLLPARNPLHLATSAHIAKLLVESVPSDKQTAFLLHTDDYQETALHAACREGHDEVVEYLCSISTPQLLHYRDVHGNTALHNARTKKSVQLLVESFPESMRRDFIYMKNREQQTALHSIVQKRSTEPSAVKYYLNTVPCSDELLYTKDCCGRTALHWARTAEIARVLIEAAHDKCTYINVADNEGNTAVMYMVRCGAIEALQSTLNCLDIEDITSVFLMKNKKRQNILHLVCISSLVENLYEGLEEYLDCVKIEDLFTADIYNNTHFTYLAARFCTRLFAQFILKVPLHQRQTLLLSKNNMGTSCLSICDQKRFSEKFYIEQVLCSSENISYWKLWPEAVLSTWSYQALYSWLSLRDVIRPAITYSKYDDDLYKVMLYALNVYSLRNLHMSTHSQVTAATCTVQRYHTEQTGGRHKKALPPPIVLYFDIDKNSIEEIQRQLYELDVPDRHSGLKVIVAKHSSSDVVRYLSPPGPDFIIITLVSVHSDYDILLDLQTKSFTDVEHLLEYLKNKKGVEYININSTIAKNYGKARGRRAADVMLLSGASKGKALVINNTTDRAGWQIEHKHACRVLGEQLGLQVECLYDKSADDMLTAISEFSQSSGHGSLVALSIMSHGDTRDNICGDGASGGLCSVQQVVDAFCQPDIQSITKLVFLSFCRGEISSRTNRTYNSWESTDLRDIAFVGTYSPIRRHVSEDVLSFVRQCHPFPSVDVPVNCYICFSTLPDMKDFRWNHMSDETNKMFDCLSEHLTNIYKYSTLDKRVVGTHTLNSISTSIRDVATSTQQLHRVELIPLLIDVTGIVREKSRFTQYMNLCYALDKDSKPLVVEVLPAGKCT